MIKNKKIISIFIFTFLVILSAIFIVSHASKQEIVTSIEYRDTLEGEISVYDFMSNLQSESKISFTKKDYLSMGKFIDSINGIKNTGSQYWIYYVNGEKANVGVSNYKINKGDIVSWKYEKNY